MTRTILLSLLIAMHLWSEPMTQGERDRAMSELHASRKMLVDAVAGLSENQLNWKSGADRWTIAEIVEHLAITEDFLFGLYKQLAGSASVAGAKAGLSDEEFLKSLQARDQKVSAPEAARPKKSFANTAKALEAFKERRTNTIAYVETNQDQDLRLKIMPEMKFDGYQTFLLIAGHTQRHVAQIAEVKATGGYPKK